MSKKIKTLITLLVIVIIGEGFLIYKFSNPEKNIIPNNSLRYFDLIDDGFIDDYVAMEGTWTSDTDLYNPIQSSKITCWKDKGICIDSKGYVKDSYLYADYEIYEIDTWNEKEIVSKNDSAICTTSIFRIDRISKQATISRSTKSTSGDCVGVSQESILLHLESGFDVWNKLKK